MLQYLLTALAGAAIAIVAMRIWQSREPSPAGAETEPAAPASGKAGRLGPLHKSFVTPKALLVAAIAMVALAIAIKVFGNPEKASPVAAPLTASPAGTQQELADVDTMIARLADRLKDNPDDGEGYRMLGWSYVMTGRPQEAIAPYRRALELLPDNAEVHAGYGRALVEVAGNKVTPEAKKEFERAVALDPKDARARYYLGLWQAQNEREKQALEGWIALANEGPPNAQWQAELGDAIKQLSAKLGVDVSDRLPANSAAGATTIPALDSATLQSASNMAAQDRTQMIEGMVERLATRLKSNGNDPDGWASLLRSRMVLGQAEQASQDLATARKALAGNSAGLAIVNAAALENKVP